MYLFIGIYLKFYLCRSALPFFRVFRLFFSGYLELENGIVRADDGTLYIASIAGTNALLLLH